MPLDYTKPSQEICPKCSGYCCVEYGSKFLPKGKSALQLQKCMIKSHYDWNCWVCTMCSGLGWIGAKLMPQPKAENPTTRQLYDREHRKYRKRRRKQIETLFKKEVA